MSKKVFAVFCVLLGIASVSFAQEPQEPVASFTVGGMVDPYAGPTPSGMRFSDGGHVIAMATGDVEGGEIEGDCPKCRFGIHGVPCDPDWRDPCMNWKLIGWYSNFRDNNQLWCEKGRGWGRGWGRGCGNGCDCESCCY